MFYVTNDSLDRVGPFATTTEALASYHGHLPDGYFVVNALTALGHTPDDAERITARANNVTSWWMTLAERRYAA